MKSEYTTCSSIAIIAEEPHLKRQQGITGQTVEKKTNKQVPWNIYQKWLWNRKRNPEKLLGDTDREDFEFLGHTEQELVSFLSIHAKTIPIRPQ